MNTLNVEGNNTERINWSSWKQKLYLAILFKILSLHILRASVLLWIYLGYIYKSTKYVCVKMSLQTLFVMLNTRHNVNVHHEGTDKRNHDTGTGRQSMPGLKRLRSISVCANVTGSLRCKLQRAKYRKCMICFAYFSKISLGKREFWWREAGYNYSSFYSFL